MNIILSGWRALVDYLTIQRIISLLIAFFLSGAISQFLSQGAVLKYFGPNAKRSTAYAIASVSGAILTVCSCSVLPMFASIRKKGAGIGPAVTFLFSGPAINILAITFTFNLIGFDVGLARVIAAVVISIIIGLVMYLLFNRSETVDPNENLFEVKEETSRALWQNLLFFTVLTAMLISGVRNPVPTTILFFVLLVILRLYFSLEELKDWGGATWDLAKRIVPLFIAGIFVAGMIQAVIPEAFIVRFAGNNTFLANLTAAVFGAFMYFSTLTEVPIVQSFMELGMIKGPAAALLLAGPSLSLPNMIVISRVLGIRKTSAYIGLVILLSASAGLLAGYIMN